MKKICVFGSSSSVIEKTYLDATYRLGELLAENGWELVFGAGTMGMMGAAARGACVSVFPKYNHPSGQSPFQSIDSAYTIIVYRSVCTVIL